MALRLDKARASNTALFWVTLGCVCFWCGVAIVAALILWGPPIDLSLRTERDKLCFPIPRTVLAGVIP